jgi:hypothetical protein
MTAVVVMLRAGPGQDHGNQDRRPGHEQRSGHRTDQKPHADSSPPDALPINILGLHGVPTR